MSSLEKPFFSTWSTTVKISRGLLVIKRASALPCILEPQLTCRPLIPIFSHLIPFITHPGVKTGISFHKQTFLELTPHCVLVIIESIQGVQTNHVPFVCSYASLLSWAKPTRLQGLRTHFFWALTFTRERDNEKWRVFQTDAAVSWIKCYIVN